MTGEGPGRHRAGPRWRRRWRVSPAAQWLLSASALVQVAVMLGTGLPLPRWLLAADCAIIVGYAAAVLGRGRFT